MVSYLKIGVVWAVSIFLLTGTRLSGLEVWEQIQNAEITYHKIVTTNQAPPTLISQKIEISQYTITEGSGETSATESESRGEDKSKFLDVKTIEELVPKNIKFQKLHISDVSGDKNGDLWVATGADFIYKINGKTYESTAVTLPENEGAVCLACDNQNRIWVGTVCDGVFIFNGLE